MAKLRLAFLILCVSSMTAGSSAAQDWSGPTSLGIEVKTKSGKPLAGARVLLQYAEVQPFDGPPAAITDSQGRVEVIHLAEGRWRIDIQSEGRTAYTVVVRIEPGKKPAITAGPIRDAVAQPLKVAFVKSPKALSVTAAKTPQVRTERAENKKRDRSERSRKRRRAVAPEPATPSKPSEPEPRTPQPTRDEPKEAAPRPQPVAVDAPAAQPQQPAPSKPVAKEPSPEPAARAEAPAPKVEPPGSAPVVPAPQEAKEAGVPPTTPEPQPKPVPEPSIQHPAPSTPEPPPEVEAPSEPEAADLPAPQETQKVEVPAPIPTPTPAPTPPLPKPAPPAAPQPAAEPEAEPEPAAITPSGLESRQRREIRSFTEPSCPGCKPGEWALIVEQEVAAASSRRGCPSNTGDLREAMGQLAEAAGSRLGTHQGPVLDLAEGTQRRAMSPFVAANSQCQAVAAALPQGTRFAGYGYEVRDSSSGGTCQADQDCSIGQSKWIGHPSVVKSGQETLVYGLFENRSQEKSRTARMILYFKAPKGWRPPR